MTDDLTAELDAILQTKLTRNDFKEISAGRCLTIRFHSEKLRQCIGNMNEGDTDAGHKLETSLKELREKWWLKISLTWYLDQRLHVYIFQVSQLPRDDDDDYIPFTDPTPTIITAISNNPSPEHPKAMTMAAGAGRR